MTIGTAMDTSATEMSEIQSFYNGTTIFLTGATGFMGYLILEKLLRTCSGVKRIYILIREKKGKTPEERYSELFNDPVFEVMKKSVSDYSEKISMIVGDCALPNLGIGQHFQEILENEVNIVIHSAATVRFDEHLRKAVNINIAALQYMLTLCKRMRKLKSFVHISTAFSNCGGRKIIDEVFYKPPICGDEIVQLVNVLNDEYIERITPSLLKDFPNTYTMTKAIAEYEIFTHGKGLPIGIIRPSMIMATEAEPVPGWINNYYGPTGVAAATGIGLLRIMHADPNAIAEVVPGDYVTNAVLACAWDIHNKWNEFHGNCTISKDDRKDDQESFSPPIYNYVSSNMNRISWTTLNSYTIPMAQKIPNEKVIWPAMLWIATNKYQYEILCFLLHILPAFIVDTVAKLVGKKPLLMDGYKKLHKFTKIIEYFALRSWEFHEANTSSLLSKMSALDQRLFKLDLTKLNWKDYSTGHAFGIRKYIFQEPVETIPQGMKHLKKLYLAYYTLLTVLSALFLFIIYGLLILLNVI